MITIAGTVDTTSYEHLAPLEPTAFGSAGPRPAALALIGRLDRRAMAAVELAQRRGSTIACHVIESGEDGPALADRWFEHLTPPVPIELLERDGTVADTVVRHLEELARDGRLPDTVVIGSLLLPHWWQRVLHDRTARDIAATVRRSVAVEVAFAPVDVWP